MEKQVVMAELAEHVIARSIWLKWGNAGWAAPNIHHFAFESDVLVLRKSGTLIEYEIKLSKSDFEADFRKRARIRPYDNGRASSRFKEYPLMSRQEYLKAGLGSNMFYYVLPRDLVKDLEVPEWAGIITCWPNRSAGRCGVGLRRKAKMIHREKADDTVRFKILQSTYYRYWRNFANMDLQEGYATNEG